MVVNVTELSSNVEARSIWRRIVVGVACELFSQGCLKVLGPPGGRRMDAAEKKLPAYFSENAESRWGVPGEASEWRSGPQTWTVGFPHPHNGE